MSQAVLRRTHKDPTTVRALSNPDGYWEETTQRRRYSISHSDGSFFSDGSGYSNGAEADLHYEVIERLREAALRLEQIDPMALTAERYTASNVDFIPYAADIEADIRLTRQAILAINDENVFDSNLKDWLDTFAHVAAKYIGRADALCGIFFENAAAEAGKEFG